MMRGVWVVVVFVLAFVPLAVAERATIDVELSPGEVTTAGLFDLTIRVDRDPAGALPDWSALDVTLPEGWGVLRERTAPQVTLDDGRVRTERTLTIEPFLPGMFEVGPVTLPVGDGGEALRGEAVRAVVRSVLPEEEEAPALAGRAGVVEPTWPERVWKWVLLGVALVVGPVVVAWWRWRLRALARREERSYETPDAIALRALDELAARDLVGSGLVKEHFAAVSDVVRRYIEDRFALRAPEQTTAEFLDGAARSRVLSREDIAELEGFLNTCDFVKFAGLRPGAAEARAVSEAARAFVTRTKSDRVRIVFDGAGRRVGREGGVGGEGVAA